MNTGRMLDKLKNTQVNLQWNPVMGFGVFTILFLAFAWMYNYGEIISLPPQGVHQWRQTDCLSFTDNFYRDSRPFFQPALHYQGYDGTGQTISEFPIIYWTVGNIWRITGRQEWIFRALVLFLFYLGLFCLFRIAEGILHHSLWALILVFSLFSSTYLAYYANNFLADVPALSLALIAWYFLFQYFRRGRYWFLILGSLFSLFAGLLKISAALSFLALFLSYFLRNGPIAFLKWGPEMQVPGKPFRIYAHFIGVLTAWAIWYSYARWYNHQHNYGIFLIGILPIWECDVEGLRKVLFGLLIHWRQHFFRDEMHVMSVVVLGWLIFQWNRITGFARSMFLLVAGGVLGFLMLFFQVFDNHDYYALNLLIFFPVFWLVFLVHWKDRYPGWFSSLWVQILACMLILHCADFTRRRMLSRYERPEYYHTGPYETITPWLREIGVEREDRVISVPDGSPNASLYLMDQKGWSDFAWLTKEEQVEEKMKLGAQYLISYDSASLNRPCFVPFKDYLVGVYTDPRFPDHRVQVWKLKSK